MPTPQLKVYADAFTFQQTLGLQSPDDLRINTALVLASRWVDAYLGWSNVMSPADEYDWTDPDLWDSDPLVVVECPTAVRQATIAAAVRFYKSPEVPWGVAGGLGDMAVYVKTSMPEVGLMLMGLRNTWGIA